MTVAEMALTIETPPPSPVSLKALARRINAEHAAGEKTLHRGLAHFRSAGIGLLKAKAGLAHGEWLPWLRTNIDFSERTAQQYMRLAKGWAKCADAAHLTLRDCLLLIAEPWERPTNTLSNGSEIEEASEEDLATLIESIEDLREQLEEEQIERVKKQTGKDTATLVDYLLRLLARGSKRAELLGAQAAPVLALLVQARALVEGLEARAGC